MDRYYKIAKDSETGKKFVELVSRLDDFTAIYNKLIEKYGIKGCITDNTYIARVLCVNFKDESLINKDDWEESPLKGAYIPKKDSKNKELIDTWNLLKTKSIPRSEIHELLRARNPFVFCGFNLGLDGNFFIITSKAEDFDFPSDVIEISESEYIEFTEQNDMDKQEKAIEEAKNRVKEYMENGWTEHELSIYIKGFVEGSEWSIESAYHQPGDIPTNGEMILCEIKGSPMIAGPNHENFNETVEHLGIKRWAYTKDIMPGVVLSPEKKDVNPKFRKGDLVVLKSYQKCIELNKDWQLNEAALKGLMTRKFKIEDIEIENGQVFYKLDGGISTINRFPECFLDYAGNSLQVPKMNAVNPKYSIGQSVVIKSEEGLRKIYGEDADLRELIPYVNKIVTIRDFIIVGSKVAYEIREYHQEAIHIAEDVILCDANDRSWIEPLECYNVKGCIVAPDAQIAQIDTSKLNPSPMQTWSAMFSGTKGFLSSASPELRAFAAGQLLELSEMIMKEMTDGSQKGE